jgi:hypothetical protein
VVAYGVAFMAMGLGVTLFLIALALLSIGKSAARAEV